MKKDDNTLYYEFTALPGSDLEKALMKLLEDMKQNRKRVQEEYNRRVEKQKQKIERGRL